MEFYDWDDDDQDDDDNDEVWESESGLNNSVTIA